MQTGSTANESRKKGTGKKYSLESSEVQDQSLELEFFTIRSIKEIAKGKRGKLIIIGERESINGNHKEKPQFEINIHEDEAIAESAKNLRIGDIISTSVNQYNITITRPDNTKSTQIIYKPKSLFSIIKKLEVNGRLGIKPSIWQTDKGEVATLSITHNTLSGQGRGSEIDWRKISVSNEFIDSVRKLKKGDSIKVQAVPKTYFNRETKSNDIIWQALEDIQTVQKNIKQSQDQTRKKGKSI